MLLYMAIALQNAQNRGLELIASEPRKAGVWRKSQMPCSRTGHHRSARFRLKLPG